MSDTHDTHDTLAPVAGANRINRMAGHYTPPAPPPTRAQAGAACEVPSRMGNRLHYRSGRITDLDGVDVTPDPVWKAPPPPPMAAPQALPPPGPVQDHAQPSAAASSPPSRPPAAAPIATMETPYVPQPGSYPAHLISALKAFGTGNAYMTLDEVEKQISVKRASVSSLFGRAIKAQLLRQVVVDGQPALALGDWDPYSPPDPRHPTGGVVPASQHLVAEEPHGLTQMPAVAPPSTTIREVARVIAQVHADNAVIPTQPVCDDVAAESSWQAQRQNLRNSTFRAALWHDGVLEIHGLQPDAAGVLRLTAMQTESINALLDGRNAIRF